MQNRIRLVVSAGGNSTRMGGRQKALLSVPPNDTPLIVEIISRLSMLSSTQPLVVANDPIVLSILQAQATHVDIVRDRWPDAGAMGGIATALGHVTDWAIVVACDMPFVNPYSIDLLCTKATERDSAGQRRWDAVVPRVHGFPQMLHTLYHVDMLPIFQRFIDAGNLKLLDLLTEARIRYVVEDELTETDPELRSFINVNTPEDWDRALQEMKRP